MDKLPLLINNVISLPNNKIITYWNASTRIVWVIGRFETVECHKNGYLFKQGKLTH